MRTLGKIIVALIAFLSAGASFEILTGSIKMSAEYAIPIVIIYTLVTCVCIWAFIKMTKNTKCHTEGKSK